MNSSGDPDSCSEAGRERRMDAPVYVNACCPKVVLTMGRLTSFCLCVVVVNGETEEG